MYKILFFGFWLLIANSCKQGPIELDYCKMIAEDQSSLNNDMSNLEKYNADKAKRSKIFEKNFGLILQKAKTEGFPHITMNYEANDSCKYWAVTMTMIHMAQSNPHLFFSDKNSILFYKEMGKGNIEKELLERSSTICLKTMDLCNDLKPKIKSALDLWNLDPDLINEANFIKCD